MIVDISKKAVAACPTGDSIKGGLCPCLYDERQASNIPEGTKAKVMTYICFAYSGPGSEENTSLVHEDDNGQCYIEQEFIFETTDRQRLKITQQYGLSRNQRGASALHGMQELARLINSAANTFSWDMSEGAKRERDSVLWDEPEPLKVINDMAVAIEVGVKPDGTNFVKRILEPDDPDYIQVMELDSNPPAGTGLIGKHTPPSQST
jgi:hypothetical protein